MITDYRLPITDYRLPITDYRLLITDYYRLPITDYRLLPITDYRLPMKLHHHRFMIATMAPGLMRSNLDHGHSTYKI